MRRRWKTVVVLPHSYNIILSSLLLLWLSDVTFLKVYCIVAAAIG